MTANNSANRLLRGNYRRAEWRKVDGHLLSNRAELVQACADRALMSLGMVRQQENQQMFEARTERTTSRWFFGALEKLQKRRRRDQNGIADHLHLARIRNLAHDSVLHPMRVHRLQQAHRFRDVDLPTFRQVRIFAT